MGGRRGFVEKVISVDCGKEETCLELLEKVDEELGGVATVFAEMKGSKILFRIVGFEPEVQRTALKLREILTLFARRRASPKYGVTAEEIAKMVRKSVPLDVVAKILRLEGIHAEVRNNVLYADTDMDTVLEVARSVGELLEEVSKMPLEHSTRKFVLCVSAATGLKPSDVVRKAMAMGLIEDKELRMPWDRAVEEFLESLETFGEEEEF